MNQNEEVIFKTSRLTLKKFVRSDLNNLYNITSNKKVMKYFPKTLNYEETKVFLEDILLNYKLYGMCFWAAFSNNDISFIGMCGLLHQEVENRIETEIAYRINDSNWGMGYATELAEACRNYAFNTLKKDKVISIIHPNNIASKKVALKIGMKYSHEVIFNKVEHDIYVLYNT